MVFTKETKERFVEMLKNRQIIVIERNSGNGRATYDCKFIGVCDSLKWDFTPLVAEYSGCPTNKNVMVRLAVRCFDPVCVVEHTLNALQEDGLQIDPLGEWPLYDEIRARLTTFFI